MVVMILRINILKYSAKKINANQPPIYSTLNPDTNSDSPSAKSNGLRLVSARHVINQIIIRIMFPQKNDNKFCVIEICDNLYELDIITINKINKKKETSYEIIWATLRIDPMCLYLELADQPISRIKYTDILDKIKNIRILCLISYIGYKLNEIIVIIIIIINNDKAGEIYERIWFIISVEIRALLNNFKASLIGWRIPMKPVLLGPFRSWI